MKQYSLFFVLFVICLQTSTVFARSGIVPRFSSGPMSYKLSTPGIPILAGTQRLRTSPNVYEAEPTAIGIGLTYFKNHTYVDFSAQGTTDANTDLQTDTPGGPYSEGFSGNRYDFSIAAGYVFNKFYTAYFGFKVGETKASGNNNSQASFQVEGAFIGNNFVWNYSRRQALIVKLALGHLHGEIDYDLTSVNEAAKLNAFTTTVGLSYGLNWRFRISENWGLVLALTHYKYIFDDIVDRFEGAYAGEIEEKMFNSALSLSYNFSL